MIINLKSKKEISNWILTQTKEERKIMARSWLIEKANQIGQ